MGDLMDNILENLYLSDSFAAGDSKLLEEQKIRHIFIAGNSLVKHFPDFINYMQINVYDFPTENIYKYFRPAIEFIDEGRKKGEAVLVHCSAGVSRSGSIVIAYVMHEMKIGLNEAWRFVKEARSCVYPNDGFYHQLQKFEKDLGLVSKVPKPTG
eukprot:TRINITY_DN7044_c0_g2_i1.p1 TRINITY_DN7044_c0_g2~~TRINITY_DN7044_c0_g2_i1.p1  ORF type:complete len:155 (-),score=23.32 TRINITY_DN7044_c0_g2_i1:67-531(-)